MAKAIEIDVSSNGDYWQGRWRDATGRRRKCSIGPKSELSLRQARKRAAELAAGFAQKPGMASSGKAPRLADYLVRYIDGRSDLGKGSVYNYGLAGRYLRAHFGDDVRLDKITRDQARAWRAAVAKGELIARVRQLADPEYKPDPKAERSRPTDTTVCNVTKYAKAIFAQAAADDVVPFNPFDKLSSTAPEPEKDWGYIGRADLDKLLSACPTPGWRVFLGLCRLAGLRRGEAVVLPWSSVDWDRRRLTVYASKTQKSAGSGGKRVIPIEPRLYALLLEAFEAAGEGGVRIAATDGHNLLRDFDVVRKRAELPELAEPFQNMRRSRAQDWSSEVPMNTLAEWMGHSIDVAAKFYLKTADDTFTRVTNGTPSSGTSAARADAPRNAPTPSS